eukprot:EG_transcript_3048
MRISVYFIYVGACLLACAAAAFSGSVLIETFNKQQQASENVQLNTGMGQVSAIQASIRNQMNRMRTVADANARTFFCETADLPASAFAPDRIIAAVNRTIFSNWVPALAAPKQLNGFGMTFVYPNHSSGRLFDRSLQAYWDKRRSGAYDFFYVTTSPEDNLCHVFPFTWANFSTPVLGEEVGSYSAVDLLGDLWKQDDFFQSADSWVALDGNTYWFFTYLRAFRVHGVTMSLLTWDVATAWLEMMQSTLTPRANFIAFDSKKKVLAATTPSEALRLAKCDGYFTDYGTIYTNCIQSPADEHPNQEIREIFSVLHHPSWDDVNAGPIDPVMVRLSLHGQQYMGISATLFSEDDLRTIIVWYQPWVVLESDTVALTALICFLAVFSTFLLTLMGTFGVLRPLAALGGAMRTVARALKEGDGAEEREVVLEPRTPSVFHEVEAIGKDFETIMVDFLGFSSAKARDNAHAPKDPDKPFAVVFTDIQSSTELWGRNPAEMSRCLQIHHRLIRQLIRKHRLYEVKTVGDSFMVTTTCALDALRFALVLQLTFYDHYWDWDGAEELYQETTLAFDRSPRGPTSDVEYGDVWNGLRVRIGAHYGKGKVTYDEVSKGYDYYGPVVNTAARIEAAAHGGQVVVSDALLKALPAPPDPSLGLLVPLGTVPLRGVAEPPALVEVKPLSLQGRRFPALRLDRAKDDGPLETPLSASRGSPTLQQLAGWLSNPMPRNRRTSAASAVSHGSSANSSPSPRALAHSAEDLARGHAMVLGGVLAPEVLAHHLLALHHVVQDLLQPLAPPHAATVLKLLTTGWGLPPPRSKADATASVVRLVHRVSETTKVLHHLLTMPQPTPTAAPTPSHVRRPASAR